MQRSVARCLLFTRLQRTITSITCCYFLSFLCALVDIIDHDILLNWASLEHTVQSWFCSYLSSRTSSLLVGNASSSSSLVLYGGSVFSCVHFFNLLSETLFTNIAFHSTAMQMTHRCILLFKQMIPAGKPNPKPAHWVLTANVTQFGQTKQQQIIFFPVTISAYEESKSTSFSYRRYSICSTADLLDNQKDIDSHCF